MLLFRLFADLDEGLCVGAEAVQHRESSRSSRVLRRWSSSAHQGHIGQEALAGPLLLRCPTMDLTYVK